MDLSDPLWSNGERLEYCEDTMGNHTPNGGHTETLHRTTPALHKRIPVREREREGGVGRLTLLDASG